MPCSCTVDEFTGNVDHQLVPIVHPEAARISDICHISHLHILAEAIFLELFPVFGLYHNGHPLLRLAYGKFSGVQPGIFYRHPVEVDVQAFSKLSYRHTDSACTEVIGFLYQFSHFRTAEQPLQLALLRSITFLHLAAASFERSLGVLLGRAGRTSDTVTARASSEKEYDIPRSRRLPAHILSLYSTHYSAYLKPFRLISEVIHLVYIGRCKTYLVAIAGIAGSSLAAYDFLRQLARTGVLHLPPQISRTGKAHCLIYIAPA